MPASVTDFPISQGISCSMKTAVVKYNDERGAEQTRTVRTITLETTREGYDMDSLSMFVVAAACAGGFLTPAEAMSCVQSSFMDPAAACEGLKTKVVEKRKRIEDERVAAEQLAIRRSEKNAKREAEAAAKEEAERIKAEAALRIRAAAAKANPPRSTRRR